MAISIRLSEQEAAMFKDYASAYNISISELVRQSVMARIEDEIDIKMYEEARSEFEEDSTTYSFEETERLLGL